MCSYIANITNNVWSDIYVSDMLSFDERRRQFKMSYESYDLYSENVKKGFHHQFTRNTLQLNNGDGTYSEVGRLTGTEATDWSWAVLIADFRSEERRVGKECRARRWQSRSKKTKTRNNEVAEALR